MSAQYSPIQWNNFKKRYDSILLLFIGSFIFISFGVNLILYPTYNFSTLVIRTFGLLSLVLLHIILCIGPLCRLDSRFLPLLYNRRHLGVIMFLTASVHGIFSLWWFHGNGNVHPFLSLFLSNTHYDSFLFFPFQVLGFFTYLILTLMACTSHDFWLAALRPKVWKSLHMMVYVAYVLIVLHVLLGVLQLEDSPGYFILLLAGSMTVSILHVLAGYKSYTSDSKKANDVHGWLYLGTHHDIQENSAVTVNIGNEKAAIFKYNGKLSAVHNVCKHQNGPLGEGKIIDGCITCPWHGYQYKPEDGCAPAPFTEKIGTYKLKLEGEKIFIFPQMVGEGVGVSPVQIPWEENKRNSTDSFFIGWADTMPPKLFKFVKNFAISIASIAFTVLIVSSFLQNKISNGVYLYKQRASFEGLIGNLPFPHIQYISGKDVHGNPLYKILPLVNAWKFGADTLIASYCGYSNNCFGEVSGTLITRDSVLAMELSKGSKSLVRKEESLVYSKITSKSVGKITIAGEIIDPKCYLGAMNPGESKPHRSCAIRCISGGIMPMIVYYENSIKKYAVLLGDQGQPINQEVLDFVAEPISIEGELEEYGNWNIFKISPKNIKRLKNEFQ